MLGDTAVAVPPRPGRRRSTRQIAGLRGEARAARRRRSGPSSRASSRRSRSGGETLLPLLVSCATWPAPAARSSCRSSTGRSRSSSTSGPSPRSARAASRSRPAHDPNDYEVWERHQDEIGILNILNPDGTLNADAGPVRRPRPLRGPRARRRRSRGARACSRRSRTARSRSATPTAPRRPIEPYLSKQWFVRMGDVPGGIVCGARHAEGVPRPPAWPRPRSTPSAGLRIAERAPADVPPRRDRYGRTYLDWLAEKRDWCISRQLWWGHRIPIWHATLRGRRVAADARRRAARGAIRTLLRPGSPTTAAQSTSPTPTARRARPRPDRSSSSSACADEAAEAQLRRRARSARARPGPRRARHLVQLGPLAVLARSAGPTRPTARDRPRPAPARPRPAAGADCLDYYYPGSCLVTARDIITLWVARMVLTGLYLLGDVPFTDCSSTPTSRTARASG